MMMTTCFGSQSMVTSLGHFLLEKIKEKLLDRSDEAIISDEGIIDILQRNRLMDMDYSWIIHEDGAGIAG